MDTNFPNKVTAESLAEDFAFARDSGEFANDATLLRYVAAINVDATREQFVAAAIVAGYAGNSSANRFRESRHADVQFGAEIGQPVELQKDGRLTIVE